MEDQPRPVKEGVALSKQAFFNMLVDGAKDENMEHEWQWSARGTGVACEKCGKWMGRAFSWQQVRAVLVVACENRDQQPPRNVKLHSSHLMQRKADGWMCIQCGASMQFKEQKWLLQAPLYKRCLPRDEPAVQRSIGDFFGSQGTQEPTPREEPRPATEGMSSAPGPYEVDCF